MRYWKKNKLDISDGRGIAKESFLKADKIIINQVKEKLENGQIVIMDGCFTTKNN